MDIISIASVIKGISKRGYEASDISYKLKKLNEPTYEENFCILIQVPKSLWSKKTMFCNFKKDCTIKDFFDYSWEYDIKPFIKKMETTKKEK